MYQLVLQLAQQSVIHSGQELELLSVSVVGLKVGVPVGVALCTVGSVAVGSGVSFAVGPGVCVAVDSTVGFPDG